MPASAESRCEKSDSIAMLSSRRPAVNVAVIDNDYFRFEHSPKAREAVMTERRTSARKRSFLTGRVYYNHRRATIDCLVRDISGRGAKLVFGEQVAVPDVIELYLPGR